MLKIDRKKNIFYSFFRAGDYPAIDWVWFVLIGVMLAVIVLLWRTI